MDRVDHLRIHVFIIVLKGFFNMINYLDNVVLFIVSPRRFLLTTYMANECTYVVMKNICN